jgi:hypothetical protein
VRRPLVPAALLVVVLAGCGASRTADYTATGTAKCLVKKGFAGVSTDPLKIGFIAASADNGGLVARSKSGNVLTIAFAADRRAAASTEAAFRRRAPKSLRPHMSDIMESQRNAVLVWTVSPSSQELSDAESCLAS